MNEPDKLADARKTISEAVVPRRDLTLDVNEVADAAIPALTSIDPKPFSDRAFDLVTSKVDEYIADLVNESSKIAHRHRADTISAAHVQSASEYLVASSSRRLYRHLGTLGGLLLGAAISNVLSMVTADRFTAAGTLVSIAFGIVGAFIIAISIARD